MNDGHGLMVSICLFHTAMEDLEVDRALKTFIRVEILSNCIFASKYITTVQCCYVWCNGTIAIKKSSCNDFPTLSIDIDFEYLKLDYRQSDCDLPIHLRHLFASIM